MTHPAGGEIISLRSPRVKAARQLAKRAFRQRARSFLAEGPQSVGAALESGAEITELFVTAPAASRHGGLVGRCGPPGAPVHQVSGEVMAELAQTVTPQGLLAVCRFIDVPLASLAGRGPARPGGDPGQRPRPRQRRHRAAHRGRRRGGRGGVRRRVGRSLQRQVRAGRRGQPVPPAGGSGRAAGRRDQRAARGRAGDPGRGRQEARPGWTTRPWPPGWPARPPGCSATRRGGCPRTSSRWPTRPSRCPSTARPRASTWPPRPRSACTPPPASSGPACRSGQLTRGPRRCFPGMSASEGAPKERRGSEAVAGSAHSGPELASKHSAEPCSGHARV